jgi:NAD(P)-dependent dehydrogenase (short-subunit alcohol dehydrogenase family)
MVTGAGSHAGCAIAVFCAAAGAHVVAFEVRHSERAAAEITASGDSAPSVSGDVGAPAIGSARSSAAHGFGKTCLLAKHLGDFTPTRRHDCRSD